MSSIKVIDFILRNNIRTPLIQAVRHRKPRWLPIAKSKEFYVRKPTPIDPEEDTILREKYKHYRSSVKAIRYYLKTQAALNSVDVDLKHDLDEAADYQWMVEQAAEWNLNVAVLREGRQKEEMALEKERLEKKIAQQVEKRLHESLAAERLLHENKTASKSFVTEKNIDLEIEKMLDSRCDYNFALTQDGSILHGEYPYKENASSESP